MMDNTTTTTPYLILKGKNVLYSGLVNMVCLYSVMTGYVCI